MPPIEARPAEVADGGDGASSKRIVVLVGASGAGKTTVAEVGIAAVLRYRFSHAQ